MHIKQLASRKDILLISISIVAAYTLLSAPPSQSQESLIDRLSDGNYRFCSEPQSNGSLFEESGYCFRFRKTGDRVVGTYFAAPMGEQNMCVTGVLNQNIVTGTGLEHWYAWSEPVSLDSFPLQPIWDSPEIGGGHMLANNPRIVNSGNYGSDDHWAFIQYGSVQLNLDEFYRYTAGTVLPPEHCSRSNDSNH